MKITKQDFRTLNKIKKMCDNTECEKCQLALSDSCIISDVLCWWHLELVEEEEQ